MSYGRETLHPDSRIETIDDRVERGSPNRHDGHQAADHDADYWQEAPISKRAVHVAEERGECT